MTDDRAWNSAERIQESLARVVGSEAFRGALRQQQFLRFVVNESLAGRSGDIKETLIATQVYEKRPDYDPRVDSSVRVEASKLRNRLAAYYEAEGANDVVRISVPKGSYAPVFETASPAPKAGFPWRWVGLAAGIAVLAGAGLWTYRRTDEIDPSKFRVERLTARGSYSTTPAARPAAGFVVYASDRADGEVLNLWRQPLDGGAAERLTRSEFNHESPAVSADGATIVFRTDENGGQLAAVGAGGGPVRKLKDTSRGRQPRWAPNGKWLVYWTPDDEETRDYGRVYLTEADAEYGFGAVRLFGDFVHAASPIWDQGGKYVLALGTW